MTVEKVKKRTAARAEVFVGQSTGHGREDIVTQILDMVHLECGRIPELHDKLPEIEQKARQMFGGEEHYVAATYRDRQKLVAMIRQDYNGRNVTELARRYGVSRRTVYNYVKR
ncbi:MAG: helix-turn-helix domain-containing protein [Burkholderiaceae bacterium]|nr:helix-turn-helix domain-containing protein [Burkholderiaceae bacterium]